MLNIKDGFWPLTVIAILLLLVEPGTDPSTVLLAPLAIDMVWVGTHNGGSLIGAQVTNVGANPIHGIRIDVFTNEGFPPILGNISESFAWLGGLACGATTAVVFFVEESPTELDWVDLIVDSIVGQDCVGSVVSFRPNNPLLD